MAISGRTARVMYGANTVAGIGEFTITGVTSDTAESSAFGDTVKTFLKVGIDDPGEITFTGQYDPTDTNGQVALNALAGINIGMTNLYFYDQYGAGATGSSYTFWRVSTGGSILLTQFENVTLPLNGIGTCSFRAKVSGAVMERVTGA